MIKLTQTDALLTLLKNGAELTQLQAYDALRCTRLAARVMDLRNLGHPITDRWVLTETGKRIKAYGLKAEADTEYNQERAR